MVPDVMSYNALLNACAKGDKAERALELFQEMHAKGGCLTSLPTTP